MNRKLILLGSSVLLLLSPITQAAESAGLQNKVQPQAQTQTRNMSAEKNAAQATHMQNMETMTEQERKLYQQLNSKKEDVSNNSSGKGKGKGKGNGDGSGKKKRKGQSEDGGSDSDYYGSRGGGGGGGGRGRGY